MKKHVKQWTAIGALSLSMGVFAAQAQEATPEPNAEETSVALTIYNQGTALVQDRRQFTLNVGLNTINFTDVASGIDATSVQFHSLTDTENTFVLEQNYIYDLVDTSALLSRYIDQTVSVTVEDGTVFTGRLLSGRNGDIILQSEDGQVTVITAEQVRNLNFPDLPGGLITRPTLRWLLQSGTDGVQNVELNYLTTGLNWSADYVLLLSNDNTSLDLNGWITLVNTSGTSFVDATIKLIAGDVNRLPEPQLMMVDMMAPVPTATMQESTRGVAQREFYEYNLYEIERLVTVGNNETKQVEFVSNTNIPANTFYVYQASTPYYGYPVYDQYYGESGVTTVANYIEFSTDEDGGVGADLPAGRIRVYQADVDGAALLIGENTIHHTPQGEDVQIYLGNAFDLVGERRQTRFNQLGSNVIEETFEIRLRNQKDEQAVEIRVVENLFRWTNWEIIESSADYTQTDANTIEFRPTVEAGGETVITYTVRYTFPN